MVNHADLAQTKFQIPLLRSEIVPRDHLAERVCRAASELSLTLVSAAAGYGKSTLIATAARRMQARCDVVWIAIDEDDNDVNRLGASLLRALDGLDLEWELDASALLQLFSGQQKQVRQAINVVINALCSRERRRIVLYVDDFHHIVDPGLLAAFDYLIERLPAHVGLVIASRTEPDLSLAKLQASARHAQLNMDDLRFSREDVRRYLASKMDGGPDDEAVDYLLARTDGWIVGLILGATGGDLQRWPTPHGSGALGDARIFAFLAQEVLESMPPPLQEFALQCSVLPDMSPDLCNAIRDRHDAADCLEQLYRRNLFVVMTDALTPVMRFHDLFREFLQHRLQRMHASLVPVLHARAANAESRPLRAVAHFIQARMWEEARGAIVRYGNQLIRDGAISTVTRLIEQIPAQFRRTSADLCFLQGRCTWTRWDLISTARHFAAAASLYERDANEEGRLAVLLALSSIECATGKLEKCKDSLDKVAASGLRREELDYLPIGRLWLALAEGDQRAMQVHSAEILHFVEHPPPEQDTIGAFTLLGACIHSHFAGLPGSVQLFERLHEIVDATPDPQRIPAHDGMSNALNAWSLFWRGQLHGGLEAALLADDCNRRAGAVRGLSLDICHLNILYYAVCKNVEQVEHALRDILAEIAGAHGYYETWVGAYLHLAVRAYWMLDARGKLSEKCNELLAADARHEWPFMRGARLLSQAYVALNARDFDKAQVLLVRARDEQSRYPTPAFCGDARLPLAYLYLQSKRPDLAWAEFFHAIAAMDREGVLGPLLFENRRIVARLFQSVPAHLAPEDAAILANMSKRYKHALASLQAPQKTGQSWQQVLTRREQEVLALIAKGAKNQRIADELFLSIYTVKRHAANINAKLGVSGRSEAAAMYRWGK